MKYLVFLVLAICSLSLFAQEVEGTVNAMSTMAYQDTNLPLEQRADDLLARLTLDEKLALMEHRNPAIPRLGLEEYSWWNEALHGIARNGTATVYPMPIALAATWNTRLVHMVYRSVANEGVEKYRQSRQEGQHGDYTGITFFTPNINLYRDPRWGRGMETFGEDPYLTAVMGLQAVKGLQGDTDTALLTAACLKHFAVHSGPEGVRHQFDSEVSMRDLRTTYLPAFGYIIGRSNVQQVMCGYNRLNGMPCCTNKFLLDSVLRKEWGFDGLVVTDCWALNDCWERDTVIPRHESHPTAALAAKDAFGRQVDLECGSGLGALRTAVDSGYIGIEAIDEHVRRILRTRLAAGIDNPQAKATQSDPWYGKEHADPFQPATEGLVLLKNEGDVLPFEWPADNPRYPKLRIRHPWTAHFAPRLPRYAIVGPNCNDSAMALGNYNGTPLHVTTIAEGLQQVLDNSTFDRKAPQNYVCPAIPIAGEAGALPRGFWRQLRKSDAVIFAGGLSPEYEGEELQISQEGFDRGDRTQIELPRVQTELLAKIKRRTRKPVILVVCSGGAVGLEEAEPYADAIIQAFYSGEEMGNAVATGIFGANHWGRLPVTFYRSTRQLPPFDDYSMQGRTYRYLEEEPLYPFGYGLDYHHVALDSIAFRRETMTVTGCMDSQYNKKGVGKDYFFTTVVQVYASFPDDPQAPRKQLVGFSKELSVTGLHDQFSIPIEREFLKVYDESTQSMQYPKAGTRVLLHVGLSSADRDLKTIEFAW